MPIHEIAFEGHFSTLDGVAGVPVLEGVPEAVDRRCELARRVGVEGGPGSGECLGTSLCGERSRFMNKRWL